jgi:hypothetical protein
MAETTLATLLVTSLATLPLAVLRRLWILLPRAERPDLAEHAQALFWSVLYLEVGGGACLAAESLGISGYGALKMAEIVCGAGAPCVVLVTEVLLIRAGRPLRLAGGQSRQWAAQFRAQNPPPACVHVD